MIQIDDPATSRIDGNGLPLVTSTGTGMAQLVGTDLAVMSATDQPTGYDAGWLPDVAIDAGNTVAATEELELNLSALSAEALRPSDIPVSDLDLLL